MIRAVQRAHESVTGTMPDGTPYAASDPHLLGWVHAAEIDSFLVAHDRYGHGPSRGSERDEYVAQTARRRRAPRRGGPPRDRGRAARHARGVPAPSSAGPRPPRRRSASCCCTPTCRWLPGRATSRSSRPPSGCCRPPRAVSCGCRRVPPVTNRVLGAAATRAIRWAMASGHAAGACSCTRRPAVSLADRWPLPDHHASVTTCSRRGTGPATTTCCHLREVLDRLDVLAAAGAAFDRTVVALAAWFHDAVYDGAATTRNGPPSWAERALPPAVGRRGRAAGADDRRAPTGWGRPGRARAQRRRPGHPGRRARSGTTPMWPGCGRDFAHVGDDGLPGRPGSGAARPRRQAVPLPAPRTPASCGRARRAPTSTARSRSCGRLSGRLSGRRAGGRP